MHIPYIVNTRLIVHPAFVFQLTVNEAVKKSLEGRFIAVALIPIKQMLYFSKALFVPSGFVIQ